MKSVKFLVLALVLVLIAAVVPASADDVLDHAAFIAAELDTPVCIDTYVQANQSWWDGKLTVYAQSEDGAYFIYNMACATQEDANALVPGTHILVKGYKAEWSGEVEIVDATYEIVDDAKFFAPSEDLTALMDSDELISHQNEFFSVSGATVVACNDAGDAFSYAWDGSGSHDANSDLYFNVEINGKTYSLTVESYLCNNETPVYAAVEGLRVGDVINAEGFLYWYNGANPHITYIEAAN